MCAFFLLPVLFKDINLGTLCFLLCFEVVRFCGFKNLNSIRKDRAETVESGELNFPFSFRFLPVPASSVVVSTS